MAPIPAPAVIRPEGRQSVQSDSSDIEASPVQAGGGAPVAARLTPREREVITLLAQGLNGAEIAVRLALSPETVRIHIRHAREKLGARTRAHAAVLALRNGAITLDDA